MHPRRTPPGIPALRQRGSSLIEVLVSVVVASVGLLGVAGLQLTGLRSNNQSLERSQAATLAYEIADAMRANRVGTADGAFELAAGAQPEAAASCTGDQVCTAAQSAAYALDQWARRVRASLPAGAASIECSAAPCAAGWVQTVTLFWDEDRTGATGMECPSPETFDPQVDMACLRLSFTP
jgi:type IV pilus assembly protein PilV